MNGEAPPAGLLAALAETWPPAARHRTGPWLVREGQGGGKRASATSAADPAHDSDIPAAEAAMRALGQVPLFMVRDDETDLDGWLAARGYSVVDPVTVYAAPVARLMAEPVKRLRVFPHWPPLEVVAEIWERAGIGRERRAVMARAPEQRTALLARNRDRAAGAAFAAVHEGWAVVHALEVVPEQRRCGVGADLLRAAALWAADRGAAWIALAVTRANRPARALYASIGMEPVEGYHYRQSPEEDPR